MPYYLHVKCVTAEDYIACTFSAYPSMAVAREAMKLRELEKTHVVTFIASKTEKANWRDRERRRFNSGEYMAPPWSAYGSPLATDHYAHLSIKTPGLVAFTKNEEHGIADRQTAMKPGRYLAEYLPALVASHAKWIAKCSASAMTLQIATSADDIEEVYRGGPPSCMDGAHIKSGEINTSVHPVRVYGDSDLAVAYYGEKDHASGRAVIWPERKRYSRLYGGEVLEHLLKHAGYTRGDVFGARIHAIREQNGYLMPYVDGCEHGHVDGEWIVLDGDRDRGSISTQCQYGCTSPYSDDDESEDTSFTCDHCNERYDSEDQYAGDGICYECERNRRTCSVCDETGYADDQTYTPVPNVASHRLRVICEGCLEMETLHCANVECGDDFCNVTMDAGVRAERESRGVSAYCLECSEGMVGCHSCREIHANTLNQCPACAVSRRCTDTVAFDYDTDVNAVMVPTLFYSYYDSRACHVRYGDQHMGCCREANHSGRHCSIGEAKRLLKINADILVNEGSPYFVTLSIPDTFLNEVVVEHSLPYRERGPAERGYAMTHYTTDAHV